MKKKFLALVMTLSMVLSLVPMTALATEGDSTEQTTTTTEGQPTGADVNKGDQEGNSNAGGGSTPTSVGGSSDTSDTNTNNGSNENAGGTESGDSSTSGTGSTEGGDTGTGGGTESGGTTTPPESSNKVAKIGNNKYETLDEAIEAAENDQTIQLLKDFSLESGITVENKTLTIQGDGQDKQTITLKGLGIHADKSNLTFKDCGLEITANDNHGHGGTANLISNSNLTFDNVKLTISSEPEGQGSGLYLYQESNLYLTNYSVAKVSGYNAKKASGIYADNSEYDGMPNRNIKVSNHAVLTISDCDWHGMTINPIDLTIDGYSKIDISECGNEGYGGGLGCYYGKLTISDHSNLNTSDNNGSGWGTFVKELSLDGTSTLISCENSGNGIDIGGAGKILAGATVTIEDNAKSGLVSYTGSNYWFGDVNVAEGANVEIHNNAHGIYVKPDGKLDMQAGNVTLNKGSEYGGGLWNEGGMVALGNKVALYNNHATKAGDDVYNEKNATLTFSSVGNNWTLDDCNDKINGWYEDNAGKRWSAHDKPLFVKVTRDFNITAEENKTYALKAAHDLIPIDPDDPGNTTWDHSKSKTATNLDSNYESEITLSLPSAEEELTSDIVFVIDKSNSSKEKSTAEGLEMLKNLTPNAVINVGIIVFDGDAHIAYNLQKFTNNEENLQELVNAINSTPSEADKLSGTNIDAGLTAAKKMLSEAKDNTPDSRKHVILVSDGLTRLFTGEDGKTKIIFNQQDADGTRYFGEYTTWCLSNGFKDGEYKVPGGDWNNYFAKVTMLVNDDKDKYVLDFTGDSSLKSAPEKFIPFDDIQTSALCIDRAFYEAYKAYKALDHYKFYAVCTGDSELGISFMDALNNGEKVDFTSIGEDVNYLVSAGSYVTDYMGYVEGDYNFDFINDVSKLTVTVGKGESKETLKAEKIGENCYGFGRMAIAQTLERAAAEISGYRYVLEYVPGEKKDDEHFIWHINVPVSNFAPVALTYSVKLVNPKSASGTYGQYDVDGSKKYSGLYTNNSATLYPMDSQENEGIPENFLKPTVSYTVSGGGGGGGGGGSITIPDDVPTGLDLKNHYGYIIGYPVDYYTGKPTTDQTKKPVRPEGKITRAEVATIYFRMLTDENRAANWNQVSGFSDVKSSAWYNNAISTLTKAGILKGYEDGTFQPNGYITRAEFATIAIRFFSGVYEGEDLFPDIKGHWAEDYINNAANKGLVKGYEDGTFGPDRYITRAEAVTLVNRTLNRHPHNDGLHKDMLVWPDNMDTSKWYYADMQEATNSHEPDKNKSTADKEYWGKMLPIRDWEALEKEWSNANSAPGEGEVV